MTNYHLKPLDTLPSSDWQEKRDKRRKLLQEVRHRRRLIYQRLRDKHKIRTF